MQTLSSLSTPVWLAVQQACIPLLAVDWFLSALLPGFEQGAGMEQALKREVLPTPPASPVKLAGQAAGKLLARRICWN